MSDERLLLTRNDLEIEVSPRIGGSVTAAKSRGIDFLRPAAVRMDRGALDTSCFPLLPFSNRIRDRRFTFAGIDHDLAANWNGDCHAIHGLGWIRPWTVERVEHAECLLSHVGDDWWPWPYSAEQHIALRDDGLHLELTILNTGSDSMPSGLGFHPYFPRNTQTSMCFQADSVWHPVGHELSGPKPLATWFDFTKLNPVGEGGVDHCYEGWTGDATIAYPDFGLSVLLASPDATRCVVYTPRGQSYLCIEPVSHLSGALNMADPEEAGICVLQPGEKQSFSMSIKPLWVGTDSQGHRQ